MSTLRRISPVLVVDAIAPSLPFFARVGFEQTIEVPGPDGALGFVILVKDGLEVMLQTQASVEDDVASIGELTQGSRQFLFIEVESIDTIEAEFAGVDPILPRRDTFYGATEIGYQEPGGHVLVFAEMSEQPEA